MIELETEVTSLQITTKLLREFAVASFLILVGLASWEWLRHERLAVALIFAGLGIAIGAVGLWSPNTIQPLFAGLMTITRPIGWLVSHVMLAGIYYIVFTPIAMLFRMLGRDVLARRGPLNKETYWQPKPAVSDMQSYLRQS